MSILGFRALGLGLTVWQLMIMGSLQVVLCPLGLRFSRVGRGEVTATRAMLALAPLSPKTRKSPKPEALSQKPFQRQKTLRPPLNHKPFQRPKNPKTLRPNQQTKTQSQGLKKSETWPRRRRRRTLSGSGLNILIDSFL